MHNDIGTDDQSCYQYFIKDLETNTLISGFWDQDFDTWSRNSDQDLDTWVWRPRPWLINWSRVLSRPKSLVSRSQVCQWYTNSSGIILKNPTVTTETENIVYNPRMYLLLYTSITTFIFATKQGFLCCFFCPAAHSKVIAYYFTDKCQFLLTLLSSVLAVCTVPRVLLQLWMDVFKTLFRSGSHRSEVISKFAIFVHFRSEKYM